MKIGLFFRRLPIVLIVSISCFLSGLNPFDDVRRGTGTWDAGAFGNHRAVIRVTEKADAVWVHIPWRRRDLDPERKNVLFVDAATGLRVRNICPVAVNRGYGDFVFEPPSGPGVYYVYYLPNSLAGRSNYPKVSYPEFELTAEQEWLDRHRLSAFTSPAKNGKEFPEARAVEIQSIDEFNSFYPMEVIATAEETEHLIGQGSDAPYLLFPEDRRYPVRMTDDLPIRWIKGGPGREFHGEAGRGEFYAFQIGVYAPAVAIEDVDVSFADLKLVPASSPSSSAGLKSLIPSSALSSFNTNGVNWDGKDFNKTCPVPKGNVQPLWCGVQVPKEVSPGRYEGEVAVRPKGLSPGRIRLVLDVRKDVIEDAGDSEPWRHSRLRWLNSRIAFDEAIVPPYAPVEQSGNTIACLGRSLTLGRAGLPSSFKSFFSPEVTHLEERGREILASPIALVVEGTDGSALNWKGKGPAFANLGPGAVAWKAQSEAGPFTLDCRARMEFDGFVEFKLILTARSKSDVRDIRLEIPLARDAARYMMGLGYKGGLRPAEFEWTWDQKKNQDSLWVGDVNGGLQVNYRDTNYERPLNTNFYLSKPLNIPLSWWNGGKGGCKVAESDDATTVMVTGFSGSRSVQAGESLHFYFNLLLTPFKPLDTRAHFKTRYFHAFKPVDEVARTGANTINIHHANAINPYINYPFLRPAEMKAYVDKAHARGMKVKIYYTIRELSSHAVELFALRSLGHEIFSAGPGGGFSWLQEHLGSDYIAAWFVPELKDAAIINSGMSRWHNYYLEGLAWLVRNVGIDGLYIDDVAFDRTTMKRVRKILDRGRPGALIDLHSANQYNPRDGYASSANLYLEHFPYLNRLWFGEYFDYNSAPDYWLVEVSGIPFGLMGEMLQDGGNAWRGMLFGMTNRLPWSGQNPARIWRIWDEFGIEDAEMIGFWSPNCPVRTDNADILATAYVNNGGVLVSLASWAKEPVNCHLKIDWGALGSAPEKTRLYAPPISDFQPERTFNPDDSIPIEPARGWLLILK
jgi:hypothetical protein